VQLFGVLDIATFGMSYSAGAWKLDVTASDDGGPACPPALTADAASRNRP